VGGGRGGAAAANAPQRTRVDEYAEMTGLQPGYIKPAPVAWYASHRHAADGSNDPYAFSYLFAYALDVPAGAKTLTLPNNDKIRILAITAVEEGAAVSAASTLFDTLR
jgi:alpha-mannosidase